MKRTVKPTPNKTNDNLDFICDENIVNKFRILFAGDTSFAENYVPEYASGKNIGFDVLEQYGRDYYFQKVKPILLESDLVIANLETPLIDAKNTLESRFSFSPNNRFIKQKGSYLHWSDKAKTVEYLKKYNILNVSLANNHLMDYGIDGLNQTFDILKESGIRFFGAGVNRRQAGIPYTKNIFIGDKMVKLAVISAYEYRKWYDKDFSFYAEDRKGGVNRLSISTIHRKIKRLREDHGNNVFVAVLPHWGGARSYGWKTDKMTKMGHQLVDAGADIVIGSGAHNFQEIEEYKGRLILYSIGNFMYNSLGNYNICNAIPYSLTVRLLFEINDRKLKSQTVQNNDNANDDAQFDKVKKTIKIYPIMTDNHDTRFQARFLEEQEFEIVRDILINKNSFLTSLKRYSKAGIDKIGRYMELQLN